MHKVGTNRYFWPLIEDRLWYKDYQVVTILDTTLEPVTKRHCQIINQLPDDKILDWSKLK